MVNMLELSKLCISVSLPQRFKKQFLILPFYHVLVWNRPKLHFGTGGDSVRKIMIKHPD